MSRARGLAGGVRESALLQGWGKLVRAARVLCAVPGQHMYAV